MSAPKHTLAARQWFKSKGWRAYDFQKDCWQHVLNENSGLLNAPTGSGKTYALALGILLKALRENDGAQAGLRAIWITPIRALAKDIQQAVNEASIALGLNWNIAIRTGDTSTTERQKQKRNTPQFLITTPESLHLMLAQKDASVVFGNLHTIVIDEWHELIGTKRGVQIELALSRLKSLSLSLMIWGISATIGNLEEAMQVLLGQHENEGVLVKANLTKEIEIISVLPDEMEQLPWAGHLGVKLLPKVIPLIEQAGTTLIFTNTRSQTEIWYQQIIEAAPQLAGVMGTHHGSLSNEVRSWVEEALHSGILKAVVCTSSLDLGVDFRPVEQIIQIGSPRGVARFLQRAGRSGHQPDAASRIYFVPTHSLELMEASALRQAAKQQKLESKPPVIRAFDVLCQYLVTLAVGEGFYPDKIYEEVKGTFCFASITNEEWLWALHFITKGGASLYAYDEFKKVSVSEAGLYHVSNRKTAMRHRLSIGTIVSDVMLMVKWMQGGLLGMVEEWFVARLKTGSVFWFAGKSLEIVQIKEMTVYVRKVNAGKAIVPQWMGGRMPLSSKLGETLREGMNIYVKGNATDVEYFALEETLQVQQQRSLIPAENELLIEKYKSRDGHHVFIYPFEGRLVHEGLASLFAYRIGRMLPITFSLAFNDYGFELLSDQPIPIEDAIGDNLFGEEDLFQDVMSSINAVEMAGRKFRDIAHIAGLIFTGYPGKTMQGKHLQASAGMFFQVFRDYEPDNLLMKQAYEEVLNDQLEELRLREALNRINQSKISIVKIEQPSPFCFPIMVDRLREKMSSETLAERIRKMQAIQ